LRRGAWLLRPCLGAGAGGVARPRLLLPVPERPRVPPVPGDPAGEDRRGDRGDRGRGGLEAVSPALRPRRPARRAADDVPAQPALPVPLLVLDAGARPPRRRVRQQPRAPTVLRSDRGVPPVQGRSVPGQRPELPADRVLPLPLRALLRSDARELLDPRACGIVDAPLRLLVRARLRGGGPGSLKRVGDAEAVVLDLHREELSVGGVT